MIKTKKNIFFKRELFLIIITMFLLIIYGVNFVLALPPLPTEFYGRIRIYNMNASPNELVETYDNDGVLCGSFRVVNSGSYGSLTCRADDPETSADEGFTPGENIVFRIRGGFTTIMGNNTAGYGVFQYVNLTYPIVYCGDGFCDAWYENYYACPADCPLTNGTGNITINMTYNRTNPSGGGAGAGGSASHGGTTRSSIGLSMDNYLNYSGLNYSQGEYGLGCEEQWVCVNWSECRIDGFQNRTCTDKAKCGTYDNKPAEVQKCVYTPTCFDGARNGLEEGVDCGGLCKPCITCFDTIQNCHDGSCEEGVDCGGPCPKCPTCFDGSQNCHDGSCEDGIDCNGPCEKKCPSVQVQIPGFVCKKDFNPLSNQSIFFFIMLLVIIIIDLIYSKNRIKQIGKNKELGDIKRAKQILSVRRRMYLFIFIILLIALILYLYYYFFIMCEVSYRFIWILLIMLFVSPILIHEIIRYLEYTESKRLHKIEVLLNTHYKQIDNLIRIENENLLELEEELSVDLYRLLERSEYKEKYKPAEIKLLREIYKEILSLYAKYKEKENPIAYEKILCKDIYKIVEDEKYKHLIQSDPNLMIIVNKLKILYKQYEEKQKLYDEISKIEVSKEELKYESKSGPG